MVVFVEYSKYVIVLMRTVEDADLYECLRRDSALRTLRSSFCAICAVA